MSDKRKDVTEAEQEQVGQSMLAAALQELGEFPGHVEQDQDETARRVVRAMAAAARAKDVECDCRGIRELYINTEEADAVATAFWMWSEGIDLPLSEVSALCVAGSRLLGFAQGLAAARAMTEAIDLMEEGSMFAFASRGAERLAVEYTPKDQS